MSSIEVEGGERQGQVIPGPEVIDALGQGYLRSWEATQEAERKLGEALEALKGTTIVIEEVVWEDRQWLPQIYKLGRRWVESDWMGNELSSSDAPENLNADEIEALRGEVAVTRASLSVAFHNVGMSPYMYGNSKKALVYFEKPLDSGEPDPEDTVEIDDEDEDYEEGQERPVQKYVAWLHDLKWSLPTPGESLDTIEAPDTVEEQV